MLILRKETQLFKLKDFAFPNTLQGNALVLPQKKLNRT
jgi:hypothetical protein